MTPMIPDTLRICSTCQNNVAAVGLTECERCVHARRVRAAMQGGVQRFYRPYTELPVQPPVVATEDLWKSLPRVVTLGRSAEAESFARRVTPWVGLLMLVMLTCGWLFGKFA